MQTLDGGSAMFSDGEEILALPLEYWLPPGMSPVDAGDHFRAAGTLDMYSNYAVFLCAGVWELLSTIFRGGSSDLHENSQTVSTQWLESWGELERWRENHPATLQPLATMHAANADQNSFPRVLYLTPYAIESSLR